MCSAMISKPSEKLLLQAELDIMVAAPFHFVGTVHKPSHFPSSDVDFDGDHYWQTMRFRGENLGIRLESFKDAVQQGVKLYVFASQKLNSDFLEKVKQEIIYRFNLNGNLTDFGSLCCKDPLLKPVWKRWGGMRASVGMSFYEFLIITTVLQNATVRRSVQMLDALFNNFGGSFDFDGRRLYGFWDVVTLDEVTEEYLRSLKLGYRAKTLKRQAKIFCEGIMDEDGLRNLPSTELRKKLLTIYGVGPASVGYLMFEVFKRYDALNYISPWEQKIYSRLLFNEETVSQEEILSHVEKRWGPWRMLAIHYLFEDLFWKRRNESVPWLDELIRL